MSEEKKELKKLEKIIKMKDCVEGEQITTAYDDIALQFREACVVVMTHQDMLDEMFSIIKSKGENVVSEYLDGKINEDKEIEKILRQFERSSMQFVQANRRRKEMISELASVKKHREIFGRKLFKRYGLDEKKIYKIDFKTQSIFEVVDNTKSAEA